jgi:hypothetical protein
VWLLQMSIKIKINEAVQATHTQVSTPQCPHGLLRSSSGAEPADERVKHREYRDETSLALPSGFRIMPRCVCFPKMKLMMIKL